jgi:hypothetical protein
MIVKPRANASKLGFGNVEFRLADGGLLAYRELDDALELTEIRQP